MKLVIEVDTDKLPIGNFQTRYFSKILHKKIVDSLQLMGFTVSEYDGSIRGKHLKDEKGEKIGRIGFD